MPNSNSANVKVYLNAIIFIQKKQVNTTQSNCYIKPDNFKILRHISCRKPVILKTQEAKTHKNQSAIEYSPHNVVIDCARRNHDPCFRIPLCTHQFLCSRNYPGKLPH